MQVDLTSEQEMFRDTVRKFVSKETSLEHHRELAEHPDGFDRTWWSQGAQLGFTSMLVSEDQGGGSLSGEGLMDLVIVAEELGRFVSPGPFVPTNVVTATVARYGTAAQAEAHLEGLLSGETVAAWCHGRGGAVEAKPHCNGGFTLTGTLDGVEAAAQADLFLVTARTPGGDVQLLVPTGSPRCVRTPMSSLDMVRRFGSVSFDEVEVGSEALVVGSADVAEAVEQQTQWALVLQCAETVGLVERVMEFTVEWAFDRYSFGRPLASYQALKHRFADMTMWSEACAATTDAAARAVQEGRNDAAELVRVAARYVGDRSTAIIQDCVQMHGGIGVTHEHDIHLYLRRATVNRKRFLSPTEAGLELADLLNV
ncbi:acyl-CoA dehydrogenase family protein [Nocardiopsis nanhaiensis]